MRRVGIVGASGAVGSAVVRHLRGKVELRLGARRADRLPDGVAVDVGNAASLAAFCAECDVVVNTAGPTSVVMDRVARAAIAAGADYVDAAGDEPVHVLLADLPPERRVLLSAGMMPGLTAFLPRLAARGLGPCRLTAYVGGLDRFTETAAGDYVASLGNGYGMAGASWQGRVAPRTLSVRQNEEVAFFPARLWAIPYLSQENIRIAEAVGLTTGEWFNVFAGQHLFDAFARVQDLAATVGTRPAVEALVAAAALDLAGRKPFQMIVCHAETAALRRSIVLRAPDSYTLSGAFAAAAVLDVIAHRIPAGLHYAGEVMDPATPLGPEITLQTIETATADEPEYEDGAF